jgi:hypothetical protein
MEACKAWSRYRREVSFLEDNYATRGEIAELTIAARSDAETDRELDG